MVSADGVRLGLLARLIAPSRGHDRSHSVRSRRLGQPNMTRGRSHGCDPYLTVRRKSFVAAAFIALTPTSGAVPPRAGSRPWRQSMSRRSLTKVQTKMTELRWELTTPAARFGADRTGLHRPLVECSAEVALERCCVGNQGRPEGVVPTLSNCCVIHHASSRNEATSPHLSRGHLRSGWMAGKNGRYRPHIRITGRHRRVGPVVTTLS